MWIRSLKTYKIRSVCKDAQEVVRPSEFDRGTNTRHPRVVLFLDIQDRRTRRIGAGFSTRCHEENRVCEHIVSPRSPGGRIKVTVRLLPIQERAHIRRRGNKNDFVPRIRVFESSRHLVYGSQDGIHDLVSVESMPNVTSNSRCSGWIHYFQAQVCIRW
jgi:hypothetical protein